MNTITAPMSSTASPETEAADYYKKITALLREKPSLAETVIGHVSCKHEIFSMPAFHASRAISSAAKVETYKELIRGLAAILQGKPHSLLGNVPAGQAAKPAVAEPIGDNPAHDAAAEQARRLTTERDFILPEQPAAPAPEPEAPPAPAKPAAVAVVADDPLTAQFRAIIKQILGPLDVSPEALAKQIDAAIKPYIEGLQRAVASGSSEQGKAIRDLRKEFNDALAALAEVIEQRLKSLPSGGGRELRIHALGKINTVEGITHRQFMQLATWCAADVPLWIWGPAGGGKTTLGEQIAQALGLPFYCISIDETITVGKLVGFKNLSNGDYVEGLLYRAYKEGGVVLLDEIDTNSSTIASLNAMLANNHYTFGNGERVARHENFRVLAGANTKGTGAVAGYTARVRLDAATLDRFAVIELKYDWDMIAVINGGKPAARPEWKPCDPATTAGVLAWTGWVTSISEKFGQSVLISPRAALLGARALRAGIPVEQVADALVFKLMSPDTIARVRSAHPIPTIASEPVKEAA